MQVVIFTRAALAFDTRQDCSNFCRQYESAQREGHDSYVPSVAVIVELGRLAEERALLLYWHPAVPHPLCQLMVRALICQASDSDS